MGHGKVVLRRCHLMLRVVDVAFGLESLFLH
jgi:hypothetical protein